MGAEDASALRGFTQAFVEVNGREPTVDENKRALALRRVVKDADLDPTLLFFIADANANAERARIPGAVTTAVDEGVARLRGAIPTGGTLATAVAQAESSTATFDRLTKVMAAVKRWALLSAAVSAVIALAVGYTVWRGGYGTGWDAGWNASRYAGYTPVKRQLCVSLAHVRHDLRGHRAQVQALDRERVLRGC